MFSFVYKNFITNNKKLIIYIPIPYNICQHLYNPHRKFSHVNFHELFLIFVERNLLRQMTKKVYGKNRKNFQFKFQIACLIFD